MIKQDYLVRMIQEIISLIANAILNKKKLRKQEWVEYDCLTRQILGFPAEQLIGMDMQELIGRYKGDPDEMGKIELAAMSMLKLSEDMSYKNPNSGRTVSGCSSMFRKKGIHSLFNGQA